MGDGPELSDLLLEMTIQTVRMQVMMVEADEREWKAFVPRYQAFLSAVGNLPREPIPRRAIGFQRSKKGRAGTKKS